MILRSKLKHRLGPKYKSNKASSGNSGGHKTNKHVSRGTSPVIQKPPPVLYIDAGSGKRHWRSE